MKFSLTTLLIVILWASLGLLGAYNIRRTLEIVPQLTQLTEAKNRHDDFARQQIRLCELALASDSDTKTLQAAEEKFRKIQLRYGQLQIDDPEVTAIVSIPEIVVRESRKYAWRIYVPPDQQVELAAYVVDRTSAASQVPAAVVFVPDSFTRTLPAGESVIRFQWTERYSSKWGSFHSKENPPRFGVTVSINEDDFSWQSDCRRMVHGVIAGQYPTQQPLFGSENTVELIRIPHDQRALRLVVRQANLTKAE